MSFNFYPKFAKAELRMLSGRFNGTAITSLGAHWGIVFPQGNMGEDHHEIITTELHVQN